MKMNMKALLGLAAVAGLLTIAAPGDRAQALTLSNPGLASSTSQVTDGVITEVRGRGRHRGWHRHHGWRRHHGWHRHHGWRHRHHRHWR